jgi:hypothetical protein
LFSFFLIEVVLQTKKRFQSDKPNITKDLNKSLVYQKGNNKKKYNEATQNNSKT